MVKMAQALPAYMKVDGNKLIFNGPGEIIYYIPEKYFDLSLATFIGEEIEAMGIFPYSYSPSGSDEDRQFKPFKYPTIIRFKPSETEKINNLVLMGAKKPSDYRAAYFHKGDELLCEISVPQDIDNVDKFVNLFKGGNLPDYIPYNEIHEYMIGNAQANGFNYKVSNQILGLVISEVYRDAADPSKPFRYSSMEDQTAYRAVNINMVPKFTSAYTAITSENPDEAIAAAVTNTGHGRSPLEDIMMR